jgi:hypothetical protein
VRALHSVIGLIARRDRTDWAPVVPVLLADMLPTAAPPARRRPGRPHPRPAATAPRPRQAQHGPPGQQSLARQQQAV